MKRLTKRNQVVQPQDQSIRLIALTQGQVTIVDAADYEWLNQWNWHARWNKYTKSYYAQRTVGKTAQTCRPLGLHVVLTGGKHPTLIPDHINRNTLDNRRINLRLATRTQNAINRKLKSSNKSGYRGVHWNKEMKKWESSISVNGVGIRIGFFANKEDAARAYDTAAILHFGEFAIPNFPVTGHK